MRKNYIWDYGFAFRLYEKHCIPQAENVNPSFDSVEDVLDKMQLIFGHLIKEIEQGNNVRIVGFGSFSIHNRKQRQGRNPKTGEPMTIPSKNYVSFKSGSMLKRVANGHPKIAEKKEKD